MDLDTAARQRFQSFKMGGGTLHSHSHRRSYSRNSSLSSIPPPAPDSPPLDPPPKRPTSHHRRRSSVSTRRESAELMGVSLPELPPAHSDDNINLGDRDSIRRRALLALEGKPDLAFSKVEIPDMTSPDSTNPFEFPTKPSFPPGSGLSGSAGFTAKRDSFGKMFGSVSGSKDQLGTLVEEEEEEEEKVEEEGGDNVSPKQSPQVVIASPPKSTSRHRPASLNLRPLSLVQGTVVTSIPGSLPTPTLTPPTSIRQLTVLDHTLSPNLGFTTPLSTFQTPSSSRFSYTMSDSISAPSDLDRKRRSSISYKRSTSSTPRVTFPLPTPELTPTDHSFSCTTDQDTNIQPLSVAEQHFLFRSHHALLSRITELEYTLRNRRASLSRHISFASVSSAPSSEPSDEMLQLISDLKAERDELKRDVDGWTLRVANADKHAGMLAKRIEAERREAWVARSRLGLLELEKSGLEKSLEAKDSALSRSVAEVALVVRERDGMKDEILKLNARLKDADAAVDECTRLRAALEQERGRRKELEKLLDDAGLLNTPKTVHTVSGSSRRPLFAVKPISIRPRGFGFQSVDSESSTTDVESVDDSFSKAEFTLDVVAEEDDELSDEDNGLAGYEDEEDSDASFSSPGGSSIGSADDLGIKPDIPEVSHRPISPPAKPTHQLRASLSKTWTFPRGKSAAPIKHDDEVDHFFDCLEDGGGSPPFSEEMNQNAFSFAFQFMSDDELPPFVLPSDVGVVVESTSSKNLDAVPEEDEGAADVEVDELVGEAIEGGIRCTLNPPVIRVTPPDICATPPPEIRIIPPLETTPAVRPRAEDSVSKKRTPVPEPVEDDEDESSLTFVFPCKTPPSTARTTSPPRSSPPSRPNSGTDSPSSIPRAVSLRSISPKTPTPTITFTPSKSASGRFTTPTGYQTPSVKKSSSSIPQPVTSPTKVVISSRQTQPGLSNANDSMSDLRCNFTQSGGATPKVNGTNQSHQPPSSVCEYLYAQDSSPSIMSNPFVARSPFQKLSQFMSFSWAPGAATVASYIVSSGLGGPSVDSANSGSDADTGATRRFVSKARQLERLKNRLGMEKKNGMTPCGMVSACKGCSADDVYL